MAKIEENQKKESQKENKCLFYKKWWFWIIISSILCCVNIAYAIWGCKTTNKSDILTAISGWISGVATLGVGLIAYRQNKVYKEENDKIEELHRQCDWRKEQKEIVELSIFIFPFVCSRIRSKSFSPSGACIRIIFSFIY